MKFNLMFRHLISVICAGASMALASAQDPATVKPLQIRAILLDPANTNPELYIQSKTGELQLLNLAVEGLVEAQTTVTTDGSLNLFKTSTPDLANPQANLAASVKVPAKATRLVALIIPGPPGSAPPYRMAFIEDAPKEFPWGESRIVNFTAAEFAVEAGEHKIKIDAGKIVPLPAVTKLNEYLQAQTNFHFRKGETWTLVAERQLRYLDTLRRVFLIYKTPTASSPEIRTISESKPTLIP
jgi:hypothetical protein